MYKTKLAKIDAKKSLEAEEALRIEISECVFSGTNNVTQVESRKEERR